MNKASQGNSVSRRFTTASRHSQTFASGASQRETRQRTPRSSPSQTKRSSATPMRRDASAPAQARTAGSAPPIRSRRRPIPPAIGDANAWLMTIRRAPSACSREKTEPFGSRPIDRPLRLTMRLRPRSSRRGVVRIAVGDPDMASCVHPSPSEFAVARGWSGEARPAISNRVATPIGDPSIACIVEDGVKAAVAGTPPREFGVAGSIDLPRDRAERPAALGPPPRQ